MLTYVEEKSAVELLMEELESNSERGFIVNPPGFLKHCIVTGGLAFEVANRILKKHPSLNRRINPHLPNKSPRKLGGHFRGSSFNFASAGKGDQTYSHRSKLN